MPTRKVMISVDEECYPDVRRNSGDDIEKCMGSLMGSLLGQWQLRLDTYGAECADATLFQWACESQAICNTEFDADGPCASVLTRVRAACPDATPR